jgi:cytochrome d ubiquinol oxidase subunit I
MVFRSRRVPSNRLLLWALVAGGPAAVVTMEAGWFVTEFGRQPWIVYGIIRTTAAATSAPGLGIVFGVFTVIYVALAVTLVRLLLLLARRNRERA